jgi:single-strand DNA-binding protein
MNKVILMGRLTRDPDVRYSSQGDRQLAVARFTLAVDRRGRRSANGSNEQTADFINCVAFDRQAEFAEKYLRKGTKIAITGRIQTGSYTNRDGQKVYTTDVVVEEQEFAESKAAADNNGFGRQDSYASAGYGQDGGSSYQSSKPLPQSVGDDFMNIPDGVDDEGLPFN